MIQSRFYNVDYPNHMLVGRVSVASANKAGYLHLV